MIRIFMVLVILCSSLSAFADGTTVPVPAPDMKNVTVQPGGTAVIAPVTVNVPRQTVVVPAPRVDVSVPVTVQPAAIPEELKVKVTESPYLRGDMDITIRSMPDPPAPQSWCVRNLGWCGLIGAAIIGAGVGTADAMGAFDNNVSFR